MSCEIIQFSAAARPSRAVSDKREGKPALPPPATETAKNARIRTERRDAWWLAERAADYWKARLDWHAALGTAQRHGIADSASFPSAENGTRYGLLDKWREAVVKKLLTPAPNLRAVTWKRAQLAGRRFSHLPTRKERVEGAIVDDVAFLDAHPTRRSNGEAMARSREFKEAMRQRIREIAASRDLSDEEIKPALSLRHEAVGEFVEKHDVNWPWLLEGNGRIFESDPIRLNPNMSGGELAAVVATMPEADQQVIRTLVRDVLQERDQ
jgi:hypothetical protein